MNTRRRGVHRPLIIGGLGGSGTRAVVDYLRMAGVFPGAHLNPSNDSLPFAELYDEAVDEYLRDPVSFDRSAWCLKVNRALDAHLTGKPPEQPWLIKNPRSILMLDPLSWCLEEMFFVHIVRNGIEMAFSGNQRQAMLHGARLLEFPFSELPHGPIRSLVVWDEVNRRGERFACRQPDRYIRIRYEDFCLDPLREMKRLEQRVDLGLQHSKVDLLRFKKSPRTLPDNWQRDLPLEFGSAQELLFEYGYLC